MSISKFFIIFIFVLIGCNSQKPTILQKKLEGVFDGKEWKYAGANAFLQSIDSKYRIQLLSDTQQFSKNCQIFYSNSPHIKFIFVPKEGSYSLPFPNFQESVKFIYPNGKELIASSGYLEIYYVDQFKITGYLNAEVDEKNKLEGSFEAFFCN